MTIKKVRARENHYDGLVKDKVYEVIEVLYNGEMYVLKGYQNPWYSWRFEDVTENETPETTVKEKSTHTDIAALLANKLFELGNEGEKKTGRIAFMVGEYGVDEEPSGGMNKYALAKFFERILKESKQ